MTNPPKPATKQSAAERAALAAAFDAHPLVARCTQEATAFARREGLRFDLDGMNAMLAFFNRFQAEHGHFPDSGIACG